MFLLPLGWQAKLLNPNDFSVNSVNSRTGKQTGNSSCQAGCREEPKTSSSLIQLFFIFGAPLE